MEILIINDDLNPRLLGAIRGPALEEAAAVEVAEQILGMFREKRSGEVWTMLESEGGVYDPTKTHGVIVIQDTNPRCRYDRYGNRYCS